MSALAHSLKNLRKKMGWSQTELAGRLGLAQSTIGGWERGARQPDAAMLTRLGEVFDVPVDVLLGKEGKSRPARIPVLGLIPAGIPIEAIEDILDWEDLPQDLAQSGAEYFALRVKGDSMMPEYRSGDTLIVRRTESAQTGDDAVVMVDGADATFKRISFSPDGMLILRPLNPAYDPFFFTAEQVRDLPVSILGVAVEVRRRLR